MRVDLLAPAGVIRPRTARNGDTIVDDLEIAELYPTMADGDPFLLEVAKAIVPASLVDVEVILYRQQVLTDCCANSAAVRRLYQIATEATQVRRWTSGRSREPRAKLNLSLEPLANLLTCLRQLRAACTEYAPHFRSDGFLRLFTRLRDLLSDEYFALIDDYLDALHFENGVQLSATLGPGNKVSDVRLHEPPAARRKLLGFDRRPGRTFRVPNEDESGGRYLEQVIGRGLRTVADVVSHVTDLVQNFFHSLRAELAFYIGCINLRDKLDASGYPTTMPTPLASGASALHCAELRDPALCLASKDAVTGNDIQGTGKTLILASGANSGGKSTFLRSVGTAQLMMQAGMFVLARDFAADIRHGIFSHFRIEDDAGMIHGRLKEELGRLRAITDDATSASMVLCNEPLASTNEREAAQIAGPIIDALTDVGVKVVLVTHLFDLARELHDRHRSTDLFLRAQRLSDGTRTYHLVESAPQATSHGGDIFQRVFGAERASF
ncbi:DNA mismatch repair protein [Nocardia sp. NPDC048505]|uniref:MutS-related protein n=1 Tax=Nocardia sp. NPDC048505 TaxID=3155756 RepID=UPI0033DCE1D7